MSYIKIKNRRGVSLYLALMIMTILLAMALGVSSILFGQIRIIRGMGNSVIAFYAADTGMERILYKDEWCRQQVVPPDGACVSPCRDDLDPVDGHCDGVETDYKPSGTLENNAEYETAVVIDEDTGEVKGFRSKGIYKETQRAVEAIRPIN